MFFRRDCADGAGPAVELAIPPVLLASFDVPPSVGAGWLVEVDVDGCAVDAAGVAPKRLGALLVAVVAPDDAGAELPPPNPENIEELGAAVVVAAAVPAVVVVAPLVAGALPGVDAAGLPRLNKELPLVDAGVPDPAPANRLPEGAAEDVGAAAFPPRLKDAMLEAGCEVAGAAGVLPRLKAGALLAGVDDGVEAGCAPNNDGFEAACPCAPA